MEGLLAEVCPDDGRATDAVRGEAMFKQVALAAILLILFTLPPTAQPSTKPSSDSRANGKPEELLPNPEATKAIARLGDLSPATIRERLKRTRQSANLPTLALVNKIIESQRLPIAEGKGV